MNLIHKLKYPAILLLIAAAGMASCRKDNSTPITTPPVGLTGDTWVKDSIDKFIYDSLTVPYNIDVSYRWNPTDYDIQYNVVPPDPSKVIPMLKGITNVAFPPYNDLTGSKVFLRKYLPKWFFLAGTPQYNPNGTITLGQAEGGTKITYFQVNSFSRRIQDSSILKNILHTMHHEFGHILNQNVLVSPDYQFITGGYTGTWFNTANTDARKMGFITAYAMADPKEDFVEMVACMLVGAESGGPGTPIINYEALLAQAGTTTSVPYQALKKKEAMVSDYYQKVWNINIYALQASCRAYLKQFYQ